MPEAIRIRGDILSGLMEHARREAARECCGLLAGREGVMTHAFPAANAAGNPGVSYEIAPRELFEMMREMRAARLEFLGIYHSHPQGENAPSPTDIERAYYPDVAYFILSPAEGSARPIRAFAIREGRVTELEIQVMTGGA